MLSRGIDGIGLARVDLRRSQVVRPAHPTLSFRLPPSVGKMLAFQALRWL